MKVIWIPRERIKLWKENHGGEGRKIAEGESAIFCSSLGHLSYRLGHIMAISSIYRQSSTSFLLFQVEDLVSAAWLISVLHPWCSPWDCLAVALNTPARPAMYVSGQMFNIKLQHLAHDSPICPGHGNVDRKFRTIRDCVEINANGFFKERTIL